MPHPRSARRKRRRPRSVGTQATSRPAVVVSAAGADVSATPAASGRLARHRERWLAYLPMLVLMPLLLPVVGGVLLSFAYRRVQSNGVLEVYLSLPILLVVYGGILTVVVLTARTARRRGHDWLGVAVRAGAAVFVAMICLTMANLLFLSIAGP